MCLCEVKGRAKKGGREGGMDKDTKLLVIGCIRLQKKIFWMRVSSKCIILVPAGAAAAAATLSICSLCRRVVERADDKGGSVLSLPEGREEEEGCW